MPIFQVDVSPNNCNSNRLYLRKPKINHLSRDSLPIGDTIIYHIMGLSRDFGNVDGVAIVVVVVLVNLGGGDLPFIFL